MPAPSFAALLSFCGTGVGVAVGDGDRAEDADEDVEEVCEVTDEVVDPDLVFDTAGPDGLGAIVVTALPALIVKAFPGAQTQEEVVAFWASSKQQYPSLSLPHIESTEFML